MITLYQAQHITTKEVIMVGKQNECFSLCAKANALADKIIIEVLPATLEAIKRQESIGQKNIFNSKSLDDLEYEMRGNQFHRFAQSHRDYDDDPYTVIDAEIVNGLTTKEKVQEYLKKTKKIVVKKS